MSLYGYVITPQIIIGDFDFAMPIDSTNFGSGAGGIHSFGVIPSNATLTGFDGSDLVQSHYPGRPYFVVSGGDLRANGNANGAAPFSDGDIFSIHRKGSVVRFYKNLQSAVVPVPLFESTYASDESFRFYAELTATAGTIAIQPEWGSLQYNIVRGYKYGADLQVDDFGSTQSSIKVRVYQESAIVGKGYYAEKNL